MIHSFELAQQVAAQRSALRLTQAELAELAGISLRTVRAIEAGTANPGLRQLNQVVEVLGMELSINKKHETPASGGAL